MAKMYFIKTVKYEGQVYPPNTVFDVKDKDVVELKTVGGVLVGGEPAIAKTVIKEPVIEEPVMEEPIIEKPTNEEQKHEALEEIQELRIFAKSVGIDVKESWNINRLRAEIIKVKSE
ncbi:MAG: hypothetical protein PHE51_09710 [Eubacteriales bacterium]|nr:hypothetical protein [Eubacteriales bacterium]